MKRDKGNARGIAGSNAGQGRNKLTSGFLGSQDGTQQEPIEVEFQKFEHDDEERKGPSYREWHSGTKIENPKVIKKGQRILCAHRLDWDKETFYCDNPALDHSRCIYQYFLDNPQDGIFRMGRILAAKNLKFQIEPRQSNPLFTIFVESKTVGLVAVLLSILPRQGADISLYNIKDPSAPLDKTLVIRSLNKARNKAEESHKSALKREELILLYQKEHRPRASALKQYKRLHPEAKRAKRGAITDNGQIVSELADLM